MTAWRVASAFLSVLTVERGARLLVDPVLEVRREGVDVVDAAVQPGDSRGIFVDADHESVDRAAHRFRPFSWLRSFTAGRHTPHPAAPQFVRIAWQVTLSIPYAGRQRRPPGKA